MHESSSISKFRSPASQLCGIFPYKCLKICHGLTSGFQIILLAELYRKDSEIPMSIDQLTWLASLNFPIPAGTLSAGILAQRLGSRSMVLVNAAFYVASFLLHYYSTNAIMIFASQVCTRLTAPSTLSAPYISEVSEPKFRSQFLVVVHLGGAFGSFFFLLLGSIVYWRTIALVNLIFPILAAVTVLATPNSPTWLASKGRFEETEKALCWLRGWVRPSEVQSEFRSLTDNYRKSTSGERKHEPVAERRRSKSFFFERSFYLPLAIMCVIIFLSDLGGVVTIYGYSKIILQEMNSPIDVSFATVILGAMNFVGYAIVFLFVRRVGKRNINFFSAIVVAVCYASIAIIGFSRLEGEYLWILPIALIVANTVDSAGTETVMFMLISEIFPSHVRYIGTALSVTANSIIMTLMNKSFLYVVEAITLPGTFLLFAVINLVSLCAYYFLLPETEGRSLIEIDDQYKSEKNTNFREK